MKRFAFLLVAVLMADRGHGQDAELQKNIAGTWEIYGAYEVTFTTNGTFITRWPSPTYTNVYHGAWTVENRDLIFKTDEGTNHVRIIQADSTNLVYDKYGAIITLKR